MGRLVGRDVGRPHAVALLQAQRVDRPVAAGREPVRLAGLPQRAPQPRAELGRAVELPAQLAGEGHAQRAHRHVADREVAHRHVAEVERVGRQRREHVAGARAPEPEARPARGHVAHAHRAVGRRVAADPREVVVAEGGAGHDREQLLLHARDGEVALDAAAGVEHLRVGDLPDAARDAVVAQPLQVVGGARAGDLDLGEGGLVEERGALAAGDVLGADGRRPQPARPTRAGAAPRRPPARWTRTSSRAPSPTSRRRPRRGRGARRRRSTPAAGGRPRARGRGT